MCVFYQVCKLLRHISPTDSLHVQAKYAEINLKIYGPQLAVAARVLCSNPTSKIAKENFDVFSDMWQSLMEVRIACLCIYGRILSIQFSFINTCCVCNNLRFQSSIMFHWYIWSIPCAKIQYIYCNPSIQFLYINRTWRLLPTTWGMFVERERWGIKTFICHYRGQG